MKDTLLDIVKVVSVLPFTIVKVTGSDESTVLQSRLEDATTGAVYFRGELKKPVKDFNGVFGLSNITMLSGLTAVEAFKDKEAKITLNRKERNGVSIPEEIVFEKSGFAKASYRLTAEKAIPSQAKQVGEINWDVVVDQPSKRKIEEFTQLASIYNSQETKFSVKTENRQLKFLIGDENAATHRAQVTFAEEVTGTVKPNFTWNIAGILNVLKLGSKSNVVLKISNQGILQIEVDTGLGVYTYIFAGAN